MTCFPELDLTRVPPDPELARRVPYDLAMYYLAVPVAQENGSISVAMAHPENATARAILHDLLCADIVPLRGRSDTICTAIKQIHQPDSLARTHILTWSARPELAPVVRRTAVMIANCLPTAVPVSDAGCAAMPSVLSVAGETHPALTIIAPPVAHPMTDLLRDASTPLLLIRGSYRPLARVLVVVRGFASDSHLLELAAPVLHKLGAQIVLLPVNDRSERPMDHLLCGDGPARQHLESLLQILEKQQVDVSVHVRTGDPAAQIVAELRQGDYDLLAIAAEASGQFVAHILEGADRAAVCTDRPVFILKPVHEF